MSSRKSTTGYVLLFNNCPVSWCSRKQPIIALSSTEAEYIACAESCKEMIFVKSLIEELLGTKLKTKLFVDNTSAIKLIKNGQMNKHSKHIDVRYHFINEKINEKLFELEYCPS